MDNNKNVLVIAGSSQIAQESIELLLKNGYLVYLTSRKDDLEQKDGLCIKYLDVADYTSFDSLYNEIKDIEFDAIVNFAGIVVCSPVELLSDNELKKQLDVNLFGLLRVIQTFSKLIKKGGKLINVSSVASYGIFPFISPYCLSKAASDVLLRAFSLETGIKYVSIRPGVIKTKFWDESIKGNEENFKNFENNKYQKSGEFLLKNAKKNAHNGTSPKVVAKAIYKAVKSKNAKPVINVGFDSIFVSILTKLLPQGLFDSLIRLLLKFRTRG